MNMKQVGIYLILIGAAIFALFFLGKIIEFIVHNPILGLAFIAILVGVGMLVYNLLQEQRGDRKNESFHEIDQ